MRNRIVAFACFIAPLGASPAIAAIVYQQVSDFPVASRASLLTSEIDTTPGGSGNFATTYDNFTLSAPAQITSIGWQGGYFLPAFSYTPTNFQIQVYANSSGQPGAVLDTFNISSANSNATLVGSENSQASGGELIYNYSANLTPTNLGGGTYWLSIVAELPYQASPPFTIGEWGWHSGTGGDGSSVQTLFGQTSTVGHDEAFTLNGTPSVVPEPSSLALCGVAGVVGLAVARARRKRPAARAGRAVDPGRSS